MNVQFLQIHTLTSFPATLLNRDDVGFAKRMPFGGAVRTRISSQCLKRHWRTSSDEDALAKIVVNGESVPMSVRSRRTFEQLIFEPLKAAGTPEAIAKAITEELIKTILPEGHKRKAARDEATEQPAADQASLRTEQVTVIGRPEVDYLLKLALEAASSAKTEVAARKRFAEMDRKELKKNLQAMVRGAGMDAAMFGRMTTGDMLARCDAAIHVANSFTVHDGQFETDYFSAIDDLQGLEETGSGHINTTELSSGLFYGYVVVDVPLLVSNVEGCSRLAWQDANRTLAAEAARRLIHLITKVSPGAKLGATAPYAHSSMVLVEAGRRQPRSLANAFLRPVPLRGDGGGDGYDVLRGAYLALSRHLVQHDEMYGKHEQRCIAAQEAPEELLAVAGERMDVAGLAEWAAARLQAPHE